MAQLHAERRWCITGTPVQNGVMDLFPVFRFLRYSPYDDPSIFNSG